MTWHGNAKLNAIGILFGIFLGLLCPGNASAQDIYLTGPVGPEYAAPGYIRLYAAEITNFRPLGSRSGTLALELWVTYTPYTGGTLLGYQLAKTLIGELEGGYHFENVANVTPLTLPPRGNYYFTFVLSEYNGSGFTLQDYVSDTAPGYVDGPVYSHHYPRLRIDTPRKNKTVSAKKFTLSGIVSDDIAVKDMKIYLDKKLVRTAYPIGQRWRFTGRRLSPGKHTLKIVATDQGGLSTTRKVTFFAE